MYGDAIFPNDYVSDRINELFVTNALNSNAARQMLTLHHNTKQGYDYDRHPWGQQFFTQLNDMGNYPKYCKKIAIANGMLDGTRQVNLANGNTKPFQATFLDAGLRAEANILWWRFTLLDQTIKVNSNPSGFAKILDVENEIFKISLDFSIFGVSWTQSVSNWLLDISATNTHAVCTAQGGYYTEDDSEPVTSNLYANWSIGEWNLKRDINGTPIFDFSGSIIGLDFLAGISPVTDGFDFNFIPTMSALDMNYYWRPQNANADLTQMGVDDIMSRTPFDVIVGGAPTNNAFPYNLIISAIWDVDQNNFHEVIPRNDLVISPFTAGNGNGWLLREIGDEELWLENYKLQHEASFTGIKTVKSGEFLFPHYNYPSQPQINFMAGVYSKEHPMIIESNGVAKMQYNPTNGGNYYDFGTNVNGTLFDYPISDVACDDFEGYDSFDKKGEPSSTESESYKKTESIVAFPNPATEVVSIEASKELNQIEIFSLNGELIKTYKTPKKQQLYIDLGALSKGVYVVKAHFTVGTIKSTKLVIL